MAGGICIHGDQWRVFESCIQRQPPSYFVLFEIITNTATTDRPRFNSDIASQKKEPSKSGEEGALLRTLFLTPSFAFWLQIECYGDMEFGREFLLTARERRGRFVVSCQEEDCSLFSSLISVLIPNQELIVCFSSILRGSMLPCILFLLPFFQKTAEAGKATTHKDNGWNPATAQPSTTADVTWHASFAAGLGSSE